MSAAWERRTTPPPLAAEAAHVWRFALDRPASELAALRDLLDDEERRRADRFAWPALRDRFTAGRGLLRTILGRYAATAPSEIALVYNGYGKPSLAAPAGAEAARLDLRFNLSHSGDWALLAIAAGRELGVDIETIRPELDFEPLAEHFFSPTEVAALLVTSDAERRRAFFACWTRKEAYIKALGRGLSMPLDSFDVSLAPEAAAELLRVRDLPEEPSRWLLAPLEPAENYLGALCVERPIDNVWQGEWG